MKIIPTIVITLTIISLIIFGAIELNNRLEWEDAQFYCYSSNTFSYNYADPYDINISNYTCKEIDYAVSNNLNLVSKEIPTTIIRYTECYKTYSREYVNSTEHSRSNSTRYENHKKIDLGKYYMENCLNDAFGRVSE